MSREEKSNLYPGFFLSGRCILIKQRSDLLPGDHLKRIVRVDELIGQGTFSFLQQLDLLLYRVFRNEPVNKHMLILTYPVGTADSLILSCRIPPRIDDEHIIGPREIQSNPSRF